MGIHTRAPEELREDELLDDPDEDELELLELEDLELELDVEVNNALDDLVNRFSLDLPCLGTITGGLCFRLAMSSGESLSKPILTWVVLFVIVVVFETWAALLELIGSLFSSSVFEGSLTTSFLQIESPTLQAGVSIGSIETTLSSSLSERIETSSSESSEPNFNSIPTNRSIGKTLFILVSYLLLFTPLR